METRRACRARQTDRRADRHAPSSRAASQVGEFFCVAADRLANAPFEDLLANELADPQRYQATERRIEKARAKLKSV